MTEPPAAELTRDAYVFGYPLVYDRTQPGAAVLDETYALPPVRRVAS